MPFDGLCQHNLPRERCFACNGGNTSRLKPTKTSPRVRQTLVPRTENPVPKKFGRVVVTLRNGNKEALPSSFLDINETTDCVHLDGYPHLWAIQEALERAPNLSSIEITPSRRNLVSAETRQLCASRGVAIAIGCERPGVSFEQGNTQSLYRKQCRFMHTLDPERKARFDELLAFGLRPALLTARYFQTDGQQEHVTLQKLAAAFGIPEQSFAACGHNVHGVLCYLDAPFSHNETAQKIAGRLRKKVAKLRAQKSA